MTHVSLLKRFKWKRAPLAAGLVTGLLLVCGVAIAAVSDSDPAAEKPQPTKPSPETDPKPAAQSPKKTAEATKPHPMAVKWKKVLADWRKEQPTESADNSFCYVCHLNYEEEKLVRIHQPVAVGCETCHGMSDKHSEDEDNITPPDILFPKEKIVSFCLECHKQEDLLAEEEHEEFFAEKASSKETCMDCHGKKHHVKVRTRKWDKTTGKLIWDDGVRMMEDQRKEADE